MIYPSQVLLQGIINIIKRQSKLTKNLFQKMIFIWLIIIKHVKGWKLHLKKECKDFFSNFKEVVSWGLTKIPSSDSFYYIVFKTSTIGRVILSSINIVESSEKSIRDVRNSLWSKFESLAEQINGNVDLLWISKKNLGNSCPSGQFLFKRYSASYKVVRDAKGGGIMLFIKEYILSVLLAAEVSLTEVRYLEINLRKKKVGYSVAEEK